MLPQAAHSREVVFELRELHLELPFRGHGMLREDVEDQLRPVDDPRLEGVLELALLDRRELVVDEQRFRARACERLLELDELSLADIRARLRLRSALDEVEYSKLLSSVYSAISGMRPSHFCCMRLASERSGSWISVPNSRTLLHICLILLSGFLPNIRRCLDSLEVPLNDRGGYWNDSRRRRPRSAPATMVWMPSVMK